MNKNIFLAIISISFLMNLSLSAKTFFIASNGIDSNPGTIVLPYLTVAKAVGLAVGGDTIYMRGGTYNLTTPITLSKSGTTNAKMQLWAYPGERALLNFSGTASGKVGITLTGSYWHIKGISVRLAKDNGMKITGTAAAYNTIEFCEFYENMDSGLQLGGGANNNSIINCDSYYNADPTDYGDADGFACKLDVGTNNYFFGCRAWMNVDDGWDGYMRGANDVSTSLENCWTWSNGYFKDGTDAGANANGNGFKMGGSDDKTLMHNFTLKNCLSFNNKSKGFDQNNNKGSMTLYNCTGYNNIGKDYSIPLDLNAGKTCTITNCVDLGTSKVSLGAFVIQTTNSWQTPFTTTAADFVSTLSTEVVAPRQPDGSLPIISYMHLVSGSDLIDGGTNVGLPFNGTKPDLGAWETGNYALAISSEGNGFVKLNPAGGVYQPGTIVTLTAVPLLGNHFINWSGDITGTSLQTQLTVNANQAITANFGDGTGVGIIQSHFASEMSCWPAITYGNTNIRFTLPVTEKVSAILYNTEGKKVLETEKVSVLPGIVNTIPVDLSALKPGIYIFKLSTFQMNLSCRVVKL